MTSDVSVLLLRRPWCSVSANIAAKSLQKVLNVWSELDTSQIQSDLYIVEFPHIEFPWPPCYPVLLLNT